MFNNLHVLENIKKMVLRRIFGPKRNEVQEAGEKSIMRSFITWTLLLV
jgi:hypothetical protein